MKNYMGRHYVECLPNLKKRYGIIVGKASVSDRPIIVRFHDQIREANEKTTLFESASVAEAASAKPVSPKDERDNAE